MNSNGKTSRRISLNDDDDDGGGGGVSVMSMSMSSATCAFSCVVGSVPSKSAFFLSKSRRVSSPV